MTVEAPPPMPPAAAAADAAAESVVVAINMRPLVDSELAEGCKECLLVTPGEPQVRPGMRLLLWVLRTAAAPMPCVPWAGVSHAAAHHASPQCFRCRLAMARTCLRTTTCSATAALPSRRPRCTTAV